MLDYLDTSALIKLVRSEPESVALREQLRSGGQIVSSALLVVEGRRAAARYGAVASARAQGALGAVTLLPVDDQTLESAAELTPPQLRSLDALHLAAALSLGADLGRFYCYDRRLASAARTLGVDVRDPA